MAAGTGGVLGASPGLEILLERGGNDPARSTTLILKALRWKSQGFCGVDAQQRGGLNIRDLGRDLAHRKGNKQGNEAARGCQVVDCDGVGECVSWVPF